MFKRKLLNYDKLFYFSKWVHLATICLSFMLRLKRNATFTRRQYGMSIDTVLGRLRHCVRPIRPRQAYVGNALTRRHHDARMTWARQHLRWQRRQ